MALQCPKCGKQLSGGELFCTGCGTRFSGGQQTQGYAGQNGYDQQYGYGRHSAQNTYSQQNWQDSYSQQSARSGYSQQSAQDSYGQQGWQNGYSQQPAQSSYQQQYPNSYPQQQQYPEGYAQQYQGGYPQQQYRRGNTGGGSPKMKSGSKKPLIIGLTIAFIAIAAVVIVIVMGGKAGITGEWRVEKVTGNDRSLQSAFETEYSDDGFDITFTFKSGKIKEHAIGLTEQIGTYNEKDKTVTINESNGNSYTFDYELSDGSLIISSDSGSIIMEKTE